jgi:hypothetical protein
LTLDQVLADNLEHKIARSPDWVGVDRDKAMADFMARIRKYESVYRTIGDDNLSYIKVGFQAACLARTLMLQAAYFRTLITDSTDPEAPTPNSMLKSLAIQVINLSSKIVRNLNLSRYRL